MRRTTNKAKTDTNKNKAKEGDKATTKKNKKEKDTTKGHDDEEYDG